MALRRSTLLLVQAMPALNLERLVRELQGRRALVVPEEDSWNLRLPRQAVKTLQRQMMLPAVLLLRSLYQERFHQQEAVLAVEDTLQV